MSDETANAPIPPEKLADTLIVIALGVYLQGKTFKVSIHGTASLLRREGIIKNNLEERQVLDHIRREIAARPAWLLAILEHGQDAIAKRLPPERVTPEQVNQRMDDLRRQIEAGTLTI